MICKDVIYVDDKGRPIEGRPNPLSLNPTIDEKIDYQRAWCVYADKVRSYANIAFYNAFRGNLKGPWP